MICHAKFEAKNKYFLQYRFIFRAPSKPLFILQLKLNHIILVAFINCIHTVMFANLIIVLYTYLHNIGHTPDLHDKSWECFRIP